MRFKEWFKSKPYWLKWGMLFGLSIFIFILGLSTIKEQCFSPIQTTHCNSVEVLTDPLTLFISFISGLIGFVVGSTIGFVFGKIIK